MTSMSKCNSLSGYYVLSTFTCFVSFNPQNQCMRKVAPFFIGGEQGREGWGHVPSATRVKRKSQAWLISKHMPSHTSHPLWGLVMIWTLESAGYQCVDIVEEPLMALLEWRAESTQTHHFMKSPAWFHTQDPQGDLIVEKMTWTVANNVTNHSTHRKFPLTE